MTDRQKQIYRLGQLYGYLVRKHGHWSSTVHDTQAARMPFQGFTAVFIAALKSRAINADDAYISVRVDSIDPKKTPEPLNLDEQGVWLLGKMQIDRDIKTLIDATGLTQQQLADRLGVKILTVGRWYRGDAAPKPQAVYDIEEIVLDK